MSLPPTVVHTARNIGAAITFNAFSRGESAARKQGAVPEILCLITEGELALYLGNQALQTLGQPALPSANGWEPIVIPPILVLGEAMLPAGYTKAAVGFLKSNLGMMLRASVIVSQIAVVYFTGNAVAIAVLGCIAIDALHSRKLLPPLIAKGYQLVLFPVHLTLAVIAKGTWMAAAQFVAFMVANYAIPKFLQQPDPKGNTGQLTPAILKDILEKQNPFQDFEINLAHMSWGSLPMQPNVELSELVSLGKHSSPATKTKFEKFVQNLQKQSLPTDIYQAKVVISYLKHEASETEREEILSKLAACSENQFYFIISELSERIIAGDKLVSLRTNILRYLQEIRTNRFQTKSGLIASLREGQFPINAGAFHGLIHHPHEVIEPKLPVCLVWKYLGDVLRADLEASGYAPEHIARMIEFRYYNSSEVRSWWRNFISRQSAENQGAFRRLLAAEQPARQSRVDWEREMEDRSRMMQDPRTRGFVRSHRPLVLPTSNLDSLDLANVGAHRKKTPPPRAGDLGSSDMADFEITQKVTLAMLFEMGIVQRKADLRPQVSEKAGYVQKLSAEINLRVERQNIRVEKQELLALKRSVGIHVPPSQPQPIVPPRLVLAPSVSINLPQQPFARQPMMPQMPFGPMNGMMPPMGFGPMGGMMPDENTMMQMMANITPEQKAQMQSMMKMMGVPEEAFAEMDADIAAFKAAQNRDEKSPSANSVD